MAVGSSNSVLIAGSLLESLPGSGPQRAHAWWKRSVQQPGNPPGLALRGSSPVKPFLFLNNQDIVGR